MTRVTFGASTIAVSYLACILVLLFAAAQAPSPQPLRIETTLLPVPVVSTPYNARLLALDGQPPYKWSLVVGTLPPGLKLDPSGLLLGTPTKPGPLRFTVRVTDSSTPPQNATQELRTDALAAFALRWKRPPKVENGGIFGSVEVVNSLPQNLDLTLIIVGVNDIGKAYVLGYQHAAIRPKTVTPVIPFGFTLPTGNYVVHADAYAELPTTGTLYHARLQTPSALAVT